MIFYDFFWAPDKSGRVMRSERRYGKFARTIELPEPVDATKMEGKSEQGVFTVILLKSGSNGHRSRNTIRPVMKHLHEAISVIAMSVMWS